jgi:hypothetical protein
MSRVVLPTNRAREPTLLFLFFAPLLSVLGGRNHFLGVGIFLFIHLLLSSRLMRILQLHGLHLIHLGGLSRDCGSLSTRTSSCRV